MDMSLTESVRDRLLAEFARTVPGVTHAMVVADDGTPLTTSDQLPADKAGQMAAVTAALDARTRAAAQAFGGGPVTQTIMEMAHGYLFLMRLTAGSCLAVLGTAYADLGRVVYEMTLLADRIGAELSGETRWHASPGEGSPR